MSIKDNMMDKIENSDCLDALIDRVDEVWDLGIEEKISENDALQLLSAIDKRTSEIQQESK